MLSSLGNPEESSPLTSSGWSLQAGPREVLGGGAAAAHTCVSGGGPGDSLPAPSRSPGGAHTPCPERLVCVCACMCVCACAQRQPTLLQCIHSRQAVFFVWELKWTQEPPPSLHCRFSTGFSPASEEQLSISLKPYTYEFQVENFFVCIALFFWWGSGVEAWKVISYSLPSKNQTDKIFQYNEATRHGKGQR